MAQRKIFSEFAYKAATIGSLAKQANKSPIGVCSIQVRFQHANPAVKRESVDEEKRGPWRTAQSPPSSPQNFPGTVRSMREMEFVRMCNDAGIQPRIGFIGGGNMAQAMIKGFLKSGLIAGDHIGVSDPFPQALTAAKELSVCPTSSNSDLLANYGSGVVFLAIKPDTLDKVLSDSKDLLKEAGLLVTLIAGATVRTIESALDSLEISRSLPVVRVMPNTAALIGSAASVFCRGHHCTNAQAELVRTLMETVGTCHEVPEKVLDAVTGLSGSGPAYVYTMIDALSDGGVKMGLPRPLATHLAAQTVMGAAKMVLETGKHPGELKNMVCSPGGTTITGVGVLEERNVRGSFMAAVEAATRKSQELGKQ